MALSDAKARTAKPRVRPYKLGDGDGLFLLVKPTGSKLWQMSYRLRGKARLASFGKFPDVPLSLARERRLEARQLLAKGIDPTAHKRIAKLQARNTFKHVADEYMAVAVKRGLAEGTLERNRHVMNKLILPRLGKRPIADLRPADILAALRAIEGSGRLETAARARQLISGVFRLAALSDRAQGDPTPLLRGQLRAPRKVGFPAIVAEDQFGALLRAIDRYPTPIVRLALKWASLTFPRPGELRFATWAEIHLEDGVWTIPAERAKMRRVHRVPLSAAAWAVLSEAQKVAPYSWEREGLIFPSPRGWQKPLSEITLAQALNRLGYKGRHTAHGFRSSASSILNGRGYRSDVIEACLAHEERNAVRRAYNRSEYWDERVAMMDDWAKIVAELRNRKKPKAKKRARNYADLIG